MKRATTPIPARSKATASRKAQRKTAAAIHPRSDAEAAAKRGDDGATMTIAASVPVSIVSEVKKHTGKGGFSRFVTEALQHELRNRALAEIVDDVVAESGPLDTAEIAAALDFIRS
jgi:hypothetical protein